MNMPDWTHLLSVYGPLLVAAGSGAYFLGVLIAAIRFRGEQESPTGFMPAVSVLKPCAGIEPRFHETLRSHFLQDYPNYEILFGLCGESDPALWTIRMLQAEFPGVPSRILFIPDIPDANPKTVKLAALTAAAQHEVLVISDADIRVGPDYLRRVVAPLRDDRVGLVTCLYRGLPARGLNSLLEALSMSGDFIGQVLLGRMLGGMRFALGATLATRKRQVTAIGGWTPWMAYLADDFILGNQVAAAGYQVHLARTVVETQLPARSWRDSFRQQLRWARTIRACSPAGYPGLLFAYGLPVVLLAPWLSAEAAWAMPLALTTVLLRLSAGWITGVSLARDPLMRKHIWLLPLRDAWGLLIWICSFLGNRIIWREQRYRLTPGGKIVRLG